MVDSKPKTCAHPDHHIIPYHAASLANNATKSNQTLRNINVHVYVAATVRCSLSCMPYDGARWFVCCFFVSLKAISFLSKTQRTYRVRSPRVYDAAFLPIPSQPIRTRHHSVIPSFHHSIIPSYHHTMTPSYLHMTSNDRREMASASASAQKSRRWSNYGRSSMASSKRPRWSRWLCLSSAVGPWREGVEVATKPADGRGGGVTARMATRRRKRRRSPRR